MSKFKYWTGIGSREVTPEIAELQRDIGSRMTKLGYILLSGGARGSDTNFHQGVCDVDPSLAEIWIPWNGFMFNERPSPKGSTFIVPDSNDFDIARSYYLENSIIPWFDKMKQSVQKLHGRNYYQIFSSNGGTYPASSMVIYAAKESDKGGVTGGTRSAVMIARNEKLPTFNLTIEGQRDKILHILSIKEESLCK